MSQARRGGRWGMNFISSSGPRDSLSSSNVEEFSQAGYDGSNPFEKTSGATVPPPSSISKNKRGYSDPNNFVLPNNPSHSTRAFANLGRKRLADDDDYFADANDPDADLEYLPAPGSPNAAGGGGSAAKQDDSDDSDDPLDKFMENINEEVRNLDSGGSRKSDADNKGKRKSDKGVRDDIEQEDEIESYMRFMEENPHLGLANEEEEEHYEYDADGNIIGTEKKMIDPLPPIDHSLINYAPFAKNFYIEHSDIASLSPSGVSELREKLGLRVTGPSPPKPACSFGHFGFDEPLMQAIIKAGFTQPTPIQAQAVPVALAGRDLIGIGKTGSGKTAAFLWPMILHIMDQAPLKTGDGPIGVICAPTRELAQQIYVEVKKLAKVYNLAAVCAYGGGSLYEQQKACEAGCEILVCTPGRIIELVKKKSTNFRRVTYLVFDEADKMFNLGFEPQVRSLANHVRPDRQTLLFSATFKRRLEKLARDILTDPIRIVQGEIGEANQDITQIVEVFDKTDQKWEWLTQNLVKFTTDGSVLIFVTRKLHSEEVAQKLKLRDFNVLLIHGDMHQSERNSVIQSFKRNEAPILVATDVASRGLDIPSIRTVINYEVARDIDTHTHRIGRTGRAGVKGHAYTLFVANRDPVEFAACLVQHLESAAVQHIPSALMTIANKCSWFVNNRQALASSGAGKSAVGFQPRQSRPGLGSSSYDDDTFNHSGPAAAAAAGLGAELIRPGGQQAERFTAMRAAFTSHYNRRFVSAGVEACKYTHPEMLKSAAADDGGGHSEADQSASSTFVVPANPAREKPPRKASRWQ